MSQRLSEAYVKIITSKFVPMDLPVDYVYRCVGHVADYMVDNGHAVHTDSDGVEPVLLTTKKDK